LLEGFDLVFVTKREADVVPAIEKARTGELVKGELDGETESGDF
jgi:hypothetical protein